MRLSNLVPSIPASLVASLEAIGIRTEVDLLFSAPTLEIYNRLPANTVTLQELISCTSLVTELCAAPGVSGDELLRLEDEALTADDELQCGLEEVDALLRGLGGGKVIEISGDRGAGKSTLALNIILQQLGPSSSRAIWVDTTGDFSTDKVMEALACKQIDDSVLERIQVPLSFDIGSTQALLDDLIAQHDTSLRFLVIDPITPLLGPLLSGVSAQGHAIMTEFLRQLQSFARNARTTVFVINNTTGHGLEGNKRKPALGPSFVLLTDTTLWLQVRRTVESDGSESIIHTLSIVKSRSRPIDNSIAFRIRNHTILSA